ncbi:hypothetical protein [Micromonospora sp. NPDC005324]|uniref:hypothetical protein n=1 Tax=Micromonospora sp. NPDC005324 TaxID=3157033 RepID=UPI0033B6BCD7
MRIRRLLVAMLAGVVTVVGAPMSAQADDQDPPEVTCVSVVGDTALVTAVVPEGGSPMVNHVFVIKII